MLYALGSHAVFRAYDPPDESNSLRRQLLFPSVLQGKNILLFKYVV